MDPEKVSDMDGGRCLEKCSETIRMTSIVFPSLNCILFVNIQYLTESRDCWVLTNSLWSLDQKSEAEDIDIHVVVQARMANHRTKWLDTVNSRGQRSIPSQQPPPNDTKKEVILSFTFFTMSNLAKIISVNRSFHRSHVLWADAGKVRKQNKLSRCSPQSRCTHMKVEVGSATGLKSCSRVNESLSHIFLAPSNAGIIP